MLPTVTPADLIHRLGRFTIVFLACFGIVAAALSYWGVLRSEALYERADNPRAIEAEYRIRRGRILDVNDQVMADTQGTPERLSRVYPRLSAGPAIGYYSLRYGTDGIERSFDSHLRGVEPASRQQFIQQLLHVSPTGRDIRLALDADLQDSAAAALAGQRGALVLLELGRPGDPVQIRALVSQPSFDPNRLDEVFETLAADVESPLLDRASQGLYQPGMIIQPFILAAALDQGLIALDDPVEDLERPVSINGRVLRCASPPSAAEQEASWQTVLARACPSPMQYLGETLGTTALDRIFRDFGLSTPVELPITTAANETTPGRDAALAAIGQDTLTVTPLQVARAYAALALGLGEPPRLQLVDALQGSSGAWQSYVMPSSPTTTSPAARVILDSLENEGKRLAFTAGAVAGPSGIENAWYVALVPATQPRYVLVVVLETPERSDAAARIGADWADAALRP